MDWVHTNREPGTPNSSIYFPAAISSSLWIKALLGVRRQVVIGKKDCFDLRIHFQQLVQELASPGRWKMVL
jgi:hypothetical protein